MKYRPINLLRPHKVRSGSLVLRTLQHHVTLSNAALAFASLVTMVGFTNTTMMHNGNTKTQATERHSQAVLSAVYQKFQPRGPQVAVAESGDPRVLGESVSAVSAAPTSADLTAQIQGILNSYLAQGKFIGPKGDKGDSGPAVTIADKPGMYYAPVTYYQPNPSQNFSGGSLFGATNLSSQNNITANQTISNSLTVNGNTTLSNTTITGQLNASTANLSIGSLTAGIAGSFSQNVTTAVVTANPNGSGGGSLVNDSQKFLAVGSDGFPRFVYYDNGGRDVHFVQCLNQDCTTKNNTVVASDLNGVDSPTIVMGSDGYARISYIKYTSPSELHYIRCTNADCSTKSDNIVATGSNYSYFEVALTVGSDGFARIAWNDFSNNTVRFAKCLDVACASGSTSTLASFTTGVTVSIAMAPDGFARVVYGDTGVSPSELHFVQCSSANCSTKTNSVVDNTLSPSLFYLNMVLGSDGYGRIVYQDRLGAGEKFAQCTNASCSTSTITVLNSNATAADQISIVMGTDNFPRIAYSLQSSGGEYYIQCTNSSCSTKNTATISSTAFGYPSSIALGSDGFARILYTGSNRKTFYLIRLVADNGGSATSGSSLGTSAAPYGQIFGAQVLAQQLLGQGTSTSQLKLVYDTNNYTDFTVGSNSTLTINPANNATVTIASGLVVNNASLVVQKATGYVGIGTTTPNALLTVDGTSASVPVNIVSASLINAPKIQFVNAVGKTWHMGSFSDQDSFAITRTAQRDYFQIDHNPNNSGTMTFSPGSPGLAFFDSGNVRIATLTPSSVLFTDASRNLTSVGVVTVAQGGTGTSTLASGGIIFSNGSNLTQNINNFYWDNASNRLGIGTSSPTHLITLSGGAFSDGAVWSNASDVNLKENFATMTPATILQKIDSLNIQQWNYKTDSASTTHIGPTAQDFYAAFQLGGSDTSISTIDPAGVALLGIQALDQKIAALQGGLSGNATSSVLTVTQPAVYQSTLTVLGQAYFSGDNVGEAKILAGTTSVRITFSQHYQYQPIVTISAEDQAAVGFVANRDATGFTINIATPLGSDANFAWHAFGGKGARLTVSDGSTVSISLILPAPPAPPALPSVDSSVPGTASSTLPNDGSVAGTSTPPSVPDDKPSPNTSSIPPGDSATTTPSNSTSTPLSE